MNEKKRILVIALLSIFLGSTCSAQTTQITPTPAGTQIVAPVLTPPAGVPLTEAEVPRVSIEEARAALEGGTAVIVDVRSPATFEASHIAGAINIPLGEIETNPTGLTLDKDQWIITYCT